MIFDLKSGKRRKVVQVVFGFLAFVFFISFVGFGVGSGSSGGLFDAIGLGGDSNTTSPQFQGDIDDANKTLETDPNNQEALLSLVRNHYASATQSGVSTDPNTGQTSISEGAHTELEQAVDAWTRYLKTKPKKPDVNTAANAAQAFVLLADAEGAATAQAIVAAGQKTASAYGQLAFYYYAAGKIKQGDAAAKTAVSTADPSAQDQIKKNLASIRKQAIKQQQQIEQQAQQGGAQAGEQQLQDPFGGLAGGSTGAPAPVAPAP
ncbi:MAG: hypothetical protein QOI10_3230 [Solirubrobacterales bacterium]|jgi:hypothetical protein|nr:hypothetical protein [Solirubrobacterales bacterium]